MRSTFTRRAFLGTTAAIALVAGTGLNLPWAAFAQEVPKKGGTLVASWGGFEPQSIFVPGFGGTSPTISATKILEPMLRMDASTNFLPVLATGVTAAADMLSYDVALREGVLWHDGKSLTADDVIFSALSYWKPMIAQAALVNLVSVEAVDEKNIRFTFSSPIPEFTFKSVLATSLVIPRHIYEGTEIATNPINNNPIGTGPFKYKAWVRGSHIEYEAFADYWDEGKPYVDSLVLRYWRDPASRSAAMEAGELHLGIFNPIPMPDIERLTKTGNFTADNSGYVDAAWSQTIEFNSRREIANQPAVRQALLTAIDRSLIADVVYFGHAVAGTSIISAGNPIFYNPDLPHYEFDPEKAGKMLDDAGFPLKDGKRFTLKVVAAGWFEENGKVGQFVKQAFEDIGIEVNLTVPDRATSLKQIYGDYDYDVALSNYQSYVEPIPKITNLITTDGIVQGAAFRNANGYSNPEVDDIVKQIAVEIDSAKRRELVFKMQAIVARDLPITSNVDLLPVTVYSSRVKGIGNRGDISADSFSEVWLVD